MLVPSASDNGLAGGVADDVDRRAQRQALPHALGGGGDGEAVELLLADGLDRLVRRARRGEGAGVGLGICELPDERDRHALDVGEAVLREQVLADAGSTQGHHGRLVGDLRLLGELERAQRPGSGGDLDVPPDGEAETPAGREHPMRLGECLRRRTPDASATGDHVEAGVGPRQRIHVAHAEIGVGQPVARDGDQPGRGVDAVAHRPAQRGELEREAGAAGQVEHAVAGVHADVVVQRGVLAALGRLGQRRELDRPAPPPLIDQPPLLGLATLVVDRHGHLPSPHVSAIVASRLRLVSREPCWWSGFPGDEPVLPLHTSRAVCEEADRRAKYAAASFACGCRSISDHVRSTGDANRSLSTARLDRLPTPRPQPSRSAHGRSIARHLRE